MIVVENGNGEEEAVKELVPPLAVTGLLVKPRLKKSYFQPTQPNIKEI